jgi:ribosomal protein S18 acetylase RimI-like enzyme
VADPGRPRLRPGALALPGLTSHLRVAAAAAYARRMNGTVIRVARVADVPQIAVVHVHAWQGAYRGLLPRVYLDGLHPAQRVGQWGRLLTAVNDGRSGVLVADEDGDLLGFVAYSASRDDDADPGRVGEIDAIYLRPSAWGQGVGRPLMDAGLASSRRGEVRASDALGT